MALQNDTTAEKAIGTAPGDGGDSVIDSQTLALLKTKISTVARDMAGCAQASADNRAVRFCVWPGMHDDGLLSTDSEDEQLESFDGASDQRVRWADQLVMEDSLLCMTALAQAQAQCLPRGSGTPDGARRNWLLLRYLKDSLRLDYWTQFWRLCNYMLADDPAVAAMRVSEKKPSPATRKAVRKPGSSRGNSSTPRWSAFR